MQFNKAEAINFDIVKIQCICNVIMASDK